MSHARARAIPPPWTGRSGRVYTFEYRRTVGALRSYGLVARVDPPDNGNAHHWGLGLVQAVKADGGSLFEIVRRAEHEAGLCCRGKCKAHKT